MSNLVHNEQYKMAANLFNNMAVVSMAAGAFNPLASLIFRLSDPPPVWQGIVALLLGGIGCVVFAGVAQWFLPKLKE